MRANLALTGIILFAGALTMIYLGQQEIANVMLLLGLLSLLGAWVARR